MIALGYIRVSTQDQADTGVSLDAQRAKIGAYAAMQGLTLAAVFEDAAISGSVPIGDRAGGADMLAMLKRDRVKHVVALKLDRLFRDAADALTVTRSWDAAGVALHLVDVGGQAINTSSAMGRMFLTMMAGFAELERNLIGERTATALRHKRARGERVGSIPLGYALADDGRSVYQTEEGARLRAAVRCYRAEGLSVRSIRDQVEAEYGVRPGLGTIKRIFEERAS